MYKVDCAKCDGAGTVKAFMHIKNGFCYSCKGKGHKMLTDKQHKAYLKEVEYINNQETDWQQEEKESDLSFKVGDMIQHGYFKEQIYKVINIEHNQYVTDKGLRIGIDNEDFQLMKP